MIYQSWRDVPKDKWRWKNFSPRELACKGTGRLAVDEVALDRLQALRDALGIPLLITSAYRSPEHNRNVGGVKNSLHMKGIAFDIRMENQDPQMFEIAARQAGFRGIGYYPKRGFIHIDIGPERTWGTPFPRSATNLPVEPNLQPPADDRKSIAQSTTVQAGAVQITAGAGAGMAAIATLDGTSQIVAIFASLVVILAAAWILRERIKKWADGDR